MILTNKSAKATIEYGDYQTPIPFASDVCKKLKSFYTLSPNIIIEPTFGIGNFVNSVLTTFPEAHSLYGIEINEDYYNIAQQRLTNYSTETDIQLFNDDIFSFDFSNLNESISKQDEILLIGNPPWVTNSQLSSIGSDNLPLKSNFKKNSGLDSMTGKGNFDVAEYIILQLLSEFSNYNCTLAMLCKTIVAKNIIRDISMFEFSVSAMDMFIFDTNEIFNVNCDAGLLVIKLGKPGTKICSVYDFHSNVKQKQFGWMDNVFYSDLSYYTHAKDTMNIDGSCQFEWRQGIKHDCSKVMELMPLGDNLYQNGFGKTIPFQLGEYVFPLLKSSDIKNYEITKTRKYVIVPQTRVNEDTNNIKVKDIDVWNYLQEYEILLNARRSVIYKKSPKYSIFGVGEYSFAKYKVGISGFYKDPVFALIWSDHPVMMDDTCYFVSFDNLLDSLITVALLNSPECKNFLKSVAFLDSKRPYTKEILKRIDVAKLTQIIDFNYVYAFVKSISDNYILSEDDYSRYKYNLTHRNNKARHSNQLSLFDNNP